MNPERILRRTLAMLLAVLLCSLFGVAAAEPMTFANLREAKTYIKHNQPTELTIASGKFRPSELIQIRNDLPEGAEFHFNVTWGNIPYSDETVDLDLRELKGAVNVSDLEALIALCPGLKHIDNTGKRAPSNKEMIPLMEKYPDITFDWIVNFGHGHVCATNATTFTTLLPPGSDRKLTSKNMELLKYTPHLKALDLGHNDLKTLDFLQYVPELELLIIAQNDVKDITPIGQLKHLKYAELFTNDIESIEPLANCTELIDLNISFCRPIKDLAALDNLPNLERLWINMMGRAIPEEEANRFAEAHPNCYVSYKPSLSPTDNGWRKHIRYKHYIWCFKHHEWVPFDQDIPGVTYP